MFSQLIPPPRPPSPPSPQTPPPLRSSAKNAAPRALVVRLAAEVFDDEVGFAVRLAALEPAAGVEMAADDLERRLEFGVAFEPLTRSVALCARRRNRLRGEPEDE